jgi:hypothetical protein
MEKQSYGKRYFNEESGWRGFALNGIGLGWLYKIYRNPMYVK